MRVRVAPCWICRLRSRGAALIARGQHLPQSEIDVCVAPAQHFDAPRQASCQAEGRDQPGAQHLGILQTRLEAPVTHVAMTIRLLLALAPTSGPKSN
eukprot:87081-Pleurochrysis_carterae.AAC.1